MRNLEIDVGSPEAILDSISDAFYFLTKEWNFGYVNRQASLVLGYRADELIGRNFWDVYRGLIGTELETAYRKAATERISTLFTFYFPEHSRWYEVHCYPSETGLSRKSLLFKKRFRLKEEIRVTRHRRQIHSPQTVRLRAEEIRIERFEKSKD